MIGTSPDKIPILRLHGAVSVTDLKKPLVEFLVSQFNMHSVEVVFEPQDFDPSLPHFCFSPDGKAHEKMDWHKLMRFSPFPNLFQRNQKMKSVLLSSLWSGETLEQQDYYQEIMKPGSWRYALALYFYDRYNLKSLVVVRRSESQGDFTQAERRYAEEVVHAHLEMAFKRVVKFQEEQSRRIALERISVVADVPLLLLDWEMKVFHSTQTARYLCASWNHGETNAASLNSRKSFSVPQEIRDACLQLKLEYSEMDQGHGSGQRSEVKKETVVYAPETKHLSARILLLQPNRGQKWKPVFQVCLDQLRPGGEESKDRSAANSRLRKGVAQVLSPAEREVVRHVCMGMTDKEIAECLKKSSDTVKKQLGTVFRKLSISSRSRLIAEIGQE